MTSFFITTRLAFIATLTLLVSPLLQAQAAPKTYEFGFEAENMEIPTAESMWKAAPRRGVSNEAWLKSSGGATAVPATHTLDIPVAGTWYLWVRYAVHPVRSKAFTVEIQGNQLFFGQQPYGATPEERPEVYGDQELQAGHSDLIWTRLPVELSTGETVIKLLSGVEIANPYEFRGKRIIGHGPTVDALVLTNDPDYNPAF